jgi:hypothetical protein
LRVLIGLFAVFVIVIGWSDRSGVTERLADVSEGAIGSVGSGLYLVILGGLAALIGLLILPRKAS